MSQPKILDLDKVIASKRIVKLAGEEIDVSRIPSRVTLELAEKSDLLKSGSTESFPVMLDMIVQICKPSKPDITKDWVLENTDLNQLIQLIEFVMQPLNDRIEGTKGKNEESPSQ